MPGSDKTFSDADVIRVWKRHLTKREREKVTVFFLDRLLQTDAAIQLIIAAISAGITAAILVRLRVPPNIFGISFSVLVEEFTRKVVREVAEGIREDLNL